MEDALRGWKPKQNISMGPFGTEVPMDQLMPEYKDLPKEFKTWNPNHKWIRIVDMWFFQGIKITKQVTKPGIEHSDAIRHLSAIMRSYEPSHEHKTAGVAWLLSQWYDEFEVEPATSEEIPQKQE